MRGTDLGLVRRVSDTGEPLRTLKHLGDGPIGASSADEEVDRAGIAEHQAGVFDSLAASFKLLFDRSPALVAGAVPFPTGNRQKVVHAGGAMGA